MAAGRPGFFGYGSVHEQDRFMTARTRAVEPSNAPDAERSRGGEALALSSVDGDRCAAYAVRDFASLMIWVLVLYHLARRRTDAGRHQIWRRPITRRRYAEEGMSGAVGSVLGATVESS